MDIVVSNHARFEMLHRQLHDEVVKSVVQNPQQVIELSRGRKVYQSKYYDTTEMKEMLLRVICEEKEDVIIVITVYRTSRIDKYWVGEV